MGLASAYSPTHRGNLNRWEGRWRVGQAGHLHISVGVSCLLRHQAKVHAWSIWDWARLSLDIFGFCFTVIFQSSEAGFLGIFLSLSAARLRRGSPPRL